MSRDLIYDLLIDKFGLGDLIQRLFGDPPEHVWHYTDGEALAKIVSSSHLWSTHAQFLNDPDEIGVGLDLVAGLVSDFLAEQDANGQDELCEWLKQLLEFLKRKRSADVFLTCFSEKKDGLYQWRAYANNGRGYALGFRVGGADGMSSLHLLRVIYGEAGLREKIGSILSKARDVFGEPDNASRRPALSALQTWLAALAVSYKDEAYEEEREWRIVHEVKIPHEEIPVGFRFPSSGAIVPYLSMEMRNTDRQEIPAPIDEVVIGPGLDRERTTRALEMLFAERDAKMPRITPTRVRYRPG